MAESKDRIAPEGHLWVCVACGKISEDMYGGETATPGWDESCMLNAELIDKDSLVFDDTGTRVVMIKGNEDEHN